METPLYINRIYARTRHTYSPTLPKDRKRVMYVFGGLKDFGMIINDTDKKFDTDMNQSLAHFTRQAEQDGHVYIYKDNEPRFMVIDLEKEPQIEMSEDEKFDFVTKRILNEHINAFKELAK